MLNRRYLRVKVMQALYAFFQNDDNNIAKTEKELMASLEKVYDLYIWMLALVVEIHYHAVKVVDDNRKKRLPTPEDLNPNTKFIENPIMLWLNNSKELEHEIKSRKISWQTEDELVRKILGNIRSSDTYKSYIANEANDYDVHKRFFIDMYKECISEFDLLENFFEQKSIYWADDLRLVNSVILKAVETSPSAEALRLSKLYKDESEDRAFAVDLLRNSILHEKEAEQLISDKTKNWEVERIALMDVLLMKMAIAEFLYFPAIPVKVTLNEYIEISKMYSSPKSKLFINGILDKLVQDFKEQNKMQKSGRGLVE